ncbi:hypothetical protein QR98_0053080 [Sarcoptes scabiei]|uniref:Uncharacterized protein n=1 Tax=Sarcoptes scabiei TaxID=52283 RepID=A0A132A7H6_SARSC|nr:hypothetical protein QR98_0053080 [Sarcoptes scabiei]
MSILKRIGYLVWLILVVIPISSVFTTFYIVLQPFQSCHLSPRLMRYLFENFVFLPKRFARKVFNTTKDHRSTDRTNRTKDFLNNHYSSILDGRTPWYNDANRHYPFVYHIPTPTYCTMMMSRSSTNAQNRTRPNKNPASPLTQCFWTFFWLALLLLVAYPFGFIAGQLFILFSPLTSIEFFRKKSWIQHFSQTLLWTLHLPLYCTNNMIIAKALIETI